MDGSRKPTRRLKRFMVGENEVIDMLVRGGVAEWHHGALQSFIYVIDKRPFPEDARLLSVHHDYRDKCFAFTLEHESFPEVPDGAMIPSVWWGDMRWRPVAVPRLADEPVTVEGR